MMLFNATWVDIEGFEGHYQVNNFGEVASVDRIIGGRLHKGRILKQNISNRGYARATLSLGGESHTLLVHRLVAKAFIPNPKGKPQVNHINECKHDNVVSNLEWCTQRENIRHSIHKYKGRPKTVLGKVRKCY